ncbi:MAG: hypothetical protein IPI67_11430 [Myxococcales bacterium]|nr:hypothetical protein [Myxococcales bacterium]
MVPVAVACIVSDPAEYGVAKQTPPFLDATQAKPSVLYRYDLTSGQTLAVNVPVRAEDAGDELVAQLYLDYLVVGRQTLLGFRQLAPGKFEDERTIDIPANNIVTQGCHAVSLVVTHRGNLNEKNAPILSADTAILSWWINVDDDGTNTMSECPVQGGAN